MKKLFFPIFVLISFLLNLTFLLADTESSLRKHIGYLASDELEGRGPGTDGINKAADYIADNFKAIGLTPAGDDDGWFQEFEVTIGVKLGETNTCKINTKSLNVHSDFIPLGFSSSGQITGNVVFAGYGISAREYQYDDYAGLNTKGKIVLVFTGEPGENDSASVFDGTASTIHSQWRTKAINARSKGAIGMILIDDPLNHPQEDSLLTMTSESGYHDVGMPVIRMKRSAIRKLVPQDSLETWQLRVDENTKPTSKLLSGINADISVSLDVQKTLLKNVIGFIPGTVDSLADAPVVVGAHYDHLGYGEEGSRAPGVHEIHNGADDNASGVGALIEIARELVAKKAELLRPVVFVAFTGEEIGLLGSSHYVQNPLFPNAKTIAMLNLDSVGRMVGNRLIVFGGGTATQWPHVLNGYNHQYRFDLTIQTDGYGPSDQAAFYAKDIPVLHFFTGANLDYHKPSDDADKINYPDLARIVNFSGDVATYLAGRDKPLAFSFSGNVKPPMPSGQRSADGKPKVWFGTIPDFTYEKGDGFRLNGVSPGSPCEAAGLQEGDLIVQMNDVQVKSIYELSHVLKTHKAGDVITVIFKRGDETKTVKVTLSER
ncbi:M20/M25/M40 family metallo-hydrolase [candidate division KSB1 bacterium]|nr:M20/M25/M40 family metallo-hydrolase [candidate division KSB1 bacterium]